MASNLPAFTYTGIYRAEIKNGYWYLFLMTSGKLKLSYSKTCDLYLHGGGGGGANGKGGGGGGGGYLANHFGISVAGNKEYDIVIGAGGAASVNNGVGGSSSAFGFTVEGGKGGSGRTGGAGGSGKGGNGGSSTGGSGGNGGSNTVYAFDSSTGLLYGGGGAGGAPDQGGGGTPGSPWGAEDEETPHSNTGAGGGGGSYYNGDFGSEPTGGGRGGSGIVILRSSQDDQMPIVFNGTAVSDLIFNGTKVTKVIYNGTELALTGQVQTPDRLTIYDAGTECFKFYDSGYSKDDYTGYVQARESEVDYNPDYMYLYTREVKGGPGACNYLGTDEAIDLTGYNKLVVSVNASYQSSCTATVAVTPSKHRPGTTTGGVSASFSNGDATKTLDISKLSGKYYIVFTVTAWDAYASASIKIKQVYATK